MNIIFHSNQLGLRGTEVSLFDYAFYNQEILGNTSIISSDKNSDLSSLDKFKNYFEVFLYDDFSEMYKFIDKSKTDCVYFQKAGNNDSKIVPNARNVVHAVFQYKQPHGDVYAYISKWLSNKMSNGELPFVPYIVDFLKYDHDKNFREDLSIPQDATVFGYYGGPDSFNIDFAKKAVVDLARTNKNLYFLFMNSNKFCEDSNVMFFRGTTDMDQKVAFINTCDACIHARNGGESFGLTVAEFSVKNKPVITTDYSTVVLNDLAHLDMLADRAVLYKDYDSLVKIISSFDDIKKIRDDWNAYEIYSPHQVMKKFKEVFL